MKKALEILVATIMLLSIITVAVIYEPPLILVAIVAAILGALHGAMFDERMGQ